MAPSRSPGDARSSLRTRRKRELVWAVVGALLRAPFRARFRAIAGDSGRLRASALTNARGKTHPPFRVMCLPCCPDTLTR